MTRLKLVIAACALVFTSIPALPATAHACASIECRVNCIKGYLEGKWICYA